MKLYNTITKNSLIHEIDRICGSNATKYPNRDKVSRLNTALDQYFQLARSVNKVRTIDDKNNTSIPLEEQNVTSGSNSFKINDFTNKLLGIMEVTILDSTGIPSSLIYEPYHNLPGNFEELYGAYAISQTTGVPDYYTVLGDYIYVRACPDYTKASALQIYGSVASSKFEFLRVTVNATTDVFTTASAHGLSVNDMVLFNTNGTIPTGLTADTVYYVETVPSTTTFTVATALGGSTLDITDAQSTSEHMVLNCSKTAGIAQIEDHFNYLARQASIPYLVEKKLPQKNDIASLVQEDERMIKDYFQNKDTDIDNNITYRQRPYA